MDYSAIHAELHRNGNHDHKWTEQEDYETVYEREIEVNVPAGGKPVELNSLIQRQLSEDYIEANSKSNRCKMDCIDEGGTFCLNIFYTGGTCYEPKERFETMRSTYSYCSDENKKAPSLFKYWVCPNEAACESKVVVPAYDGEVLNRQVDKWSQKFVQGDVCSYLIDTPWQMTEKDIMYLRISKIENADVYVAKGKSYLWLNHLDAMA